VHLIEKGRRYRAADGFLENTFYDKEPGGNTEELKKAAERSTFPAAYPLGALIRPSSDEDVVSPCIEWLDRQPTGSMVYVSFGSAGSLSVE